MLFFYLRRLPFGLKGLGDELKLCSAVFSVLSPVLSVEAGGAVVEVFNGLLQCLTALPAALPHVQGMPENCRKAASTMTTWAGGPGGGDSSLWRKREGTYGSLVLQTYIQADLEKVGELQQIPHSSLP